MRYTGLVLLGDICDHLDIFRWLAVINNGAHLSVRLFRLCKQAIHVFKSKTLRLWEEEVYDWHPEGVEDSKNDVCAVANISDGWRSDVYDQEVL